MTMIETQCINSKLVIDELFSCFDDQPMEHQIELIDALGHFCNNWMIKHGLNSFVPPETQWKSQIIAITRGIGHECHIANLFTGSKLFQQLISSRKHRKMIYAGQKLLEMHYRFAHVNGNHGITSVADDLDDDTGRCSANSSDTEAMGYDELDKILFSIDSAALAKDMMETQLELSGLVANGMNGDDLSSVRQSFISNLDTDYIPADALRVCSDSTVAVRTKRKYMKRKKRKEGDGEGDTTLENVKSEKKRRIVEIVAAANIGELNTEAEPDLIRDVDGIMKYKCCFCDALFLRIWHLRRHIRLHYGVKPHECCFCPKAFARAEHLRKHMRRHAGGRAYKPHACRHCPAEFAVGRELKTHMKEIHANVASSEKAAPAPKPLHQCSMCERQCPDAAQLRVHMRMHSGFKPFMCAECGRQFTRHGHLRRHMRLHTGDRPFMCNKCALQFARADHLRRHLLAHHADDDPERRKAMAPMAGSSGDNEDIDIKPDCDLLPPCDGIRPVEIAVMPPLMSIPQNSCAAQLQTVASATSGAIFSNSSPVQSSSVDVPHSDSTYCSSSVVPPSHGCPSSEHRVSQLAETLSLSNRRMSCTEADKMPRINIHSKDLVQSVFTESESTVNRNMYQSNGENFSTNGMHSPFNEAVGLDYRRHNFQSLPNGFISPDLSAMPRNGDVSRILGGNFSPPPVSPRYNHIMPVPAFRPVVSAGAVDFRLAQGIGISGGIPVCPQNFTFMNESIKWGNN